MSVSSESLGRLARVQDGATHHNCGRKHSPRGLTNFDTFCDVQAAVCRRRGGAGQNLLDNETVTDAPGLKRYRRARPYIRGLNCVVLIVPRPSYTGQTASSLRLFAR